MAEFATNSVGGTYLNASGTVAMNSNPIEVRKIKPSGYSRDVTPVFGSGSDEAVANVLGPKKRENVTVSVSLRIWQAFITASPTYGDINTLWTVSVSYKLPDGATCPIDMERCSLVKATDSEADFAAAGEAMKDLEFAPVLVNNATIKA